MKKKETSILIPHDRPQDRDAPLVNRVARLYARAREENTEVEIVRQRVGEQNSVRITPHSWEYSGASAASVSARGLCTQTADFYNLTFFLQTLCFSSSARMAFRKMLSFKFFVTL